MKIKIVTHYQKQDIDCLSDYWDVEVFIDDIPIRQYDDSYHDRGAEKAAAFADGLKWAIENYNGPDDMAKIERVDVADRD